MSVWEMLDRVTKIAAVFVIPIIVWGISAEVRLQGADQEHQRLVLEMRAYLNENVLPVWFREDVQEIKAQAQENRVLLQDLKLQVSGLTGRVEALRSLLKEP